VLSNRRLDGLHLKRVFLVRHLAVGEREGDTAAATEEEEEEEGEEVVLLALPDKYRRIESWYFIPTLCSVLEVREKVMFVWGGWTRRSGTGSGEQNDWLEYIFPHLATLGDTWGLHCRGNPHHGDR